MSIGLLGLGSYSTLFYLERLNALYNQRNGGYSTCPLVMMNVDFDSINPYLPDNFAKLEQPLAIHLGALQYMGVSAMVVPNITLHEAIERLPSHQTSPYPLVHPVNVTLEALQADQHTEAYIFGSRYSMQADYLRNRFQEGGVSLYQPEEEAKAFLDGFRQIIYQGEQTEQDIKHYQYLIERHSEERPVVIACTELSVPLEPEKGRVYDMVGEQIVKALQFV
ncbi:MAG: Unknown protein [uncultured Thiotrichaceae bacterium]|uniref:Aspartate racemase n=1 Tax=uncultured Thiotrichaceae bacterium TaxID=298394 RepID=A0A6S6UGD6_9GAMM|nr:MAG: Unknown protein [uncultured Thiotrichaceae bacterium]